MGQCIMWTVNTPGTVEDGTIYHVDTLRPVEDGTSHHVESQHTRNCGGWNNVSHEQWTQQELWKIGQCRMWTLDTPGTV